MSQIVVLFFLIPLLSFSISVEEYVQRVSQRHNLVEVDFHKLAATDQAHKSLQRLNHEQIIELVDFAKQVEIFDADYVKNHDYFVIKSKGRVFGYTFSLNILRNGEPSHIRRSLAVPRVDGKIFTLEYFHYEVEKRLEPEPPKRENTQW